MAGSFMEEPFVDQAKGQKVDCVDLALDLMEAYKDKIVLPVDLKAGDSLDQPRQSTIITSDQRDKLAEGWAYLDIGPQTIAEYQRILQSSQTVFWDGPMGKYEDQQFRDGTLKLAQTIADSKATSVLAGGDTAAAAEDFDLVFKYTHVSIAGGAALEFLAGQKLPGIEALLPKTG